MVLMHQKHSLMFIEVKNKLQANIIEFPLILKPRWGMGSIGIYKADNLEELEVFYKNLVEKYLIHI